MKIGIITFWNSNNNYGQQLQCWALQAFLKQYGHDPKLIKYVAPMINDSKTNKKIYYRFKKILSFILIYPFFRYLNDKRKWRAISMAKEYMNEKDVLRKFDEFRSSNISSTAEYYIGLSSLQNNCPHFDALIVGSDQVWAYKLDKEENEVYYLNFGGKNIKRIAYAPSFGMKEYPKEYCDALKRNLSRFDAISCRENDGVYICNSLGFKASHVLDPTLLLYSKDYESLFAKVIIPNIKTDFIYIYSLNIENCNDIYWCELSKFAKGNNCEPIVTPSSGYYVGKELFDNVVYLYATIPQWLYCIKHSKFVVTTSFHGIVFCLLFHTPFVYFPVKGKWSIGNNRVIELLSYVGMERFKWEYNSSYDNFDFDNIDWNKIDVLLDEKRKESQSFLLSSLI